jgi:hypothetical protein
MGLRRCVVLAGTSFIMTEEMSRRLRISGARAAAIAALSYSLAKRAFALFTWCQNTGHVRYYKFSVSDIGNVSDNKKFWLSDISVYMAKIA